MASRHFPVRPNLEQLKHQAKDLLRAMRRSDPAAVAEFRAAFAEAIDPVTVRLADAQFVLARSYGLANWPRLVTACRMTDAIWRGDVEAVRALVVRDPRLLEEDARGVKGNWGPPLSYAANLGQDAVIEMLRGMGARDLEYGFRRACLQGQVETARQLHAWMGKPRPSLDALSDAAYTLNEAGTALLLELGVQVCGDRGDRLAPVEVVLETDSRDAAAKHRILELYVEHGVELPDMPAMAVHRGRIDLLEAHLRRDAGLLRRRFAFAEIYPPELGCGGETAATYGTPLDGATLLHMCVEFDEMEIARWLLERGMNADEAAAVDGEGFGGHTALFGTVVSQPNFWMNHRGRTEEALFTKLLLEAGANPHARASLRKELHPAYEIAGMHVYRDVSALEWGERFVLQKLVNRAALRLIAEEGGRR